MDHKDITTRGIYKSNPFPYVLIDDFLTVHDCQQLINDANKIDCDSVFIHGGRQATMSTSLSFRDLIEESSPWRDLIANLKSESTLELLLNHIYSESHDQYYTKWLKNKKLLIRELPSIFKLFPESLRKKFIALFDLKIKHCRASRLILSAMLSIANSLYRRIKSFSDLFLGRRVLSLLYDYSVANDGYQREIHRDSDARVVVFLIYLNTLEDDVSGGSLGVHGLKEESETFEPQPNEDATYLVDEIKPKAGRLVMFLNTANAYHSVTRMGFSEQGRHFVYGAYTLNSGLSSLARKKSKGSLPTEFHLYGL